MIRLICRTAFKAENRHNLNAYVFVGMIALSLSSLYGCTPRLHSAAAVTSSNDQALPSTQTNSGYARAETAENGSPFPDLSDYIEGYEQFLDDGYATISINNKANTTDLHAKLYSLDTDTTTPIRVFFVKAWDRFHVENLEEGRYELRYRELETGKLAKTEPLVIEVSVKEGRTYYSGMELILNPVVGGNLKTEPISEDEF